MFHFSPRSTGVVDSIHNKKSSFKRYSNDLEKYNRIADDVWARHNIPSIDLYNFTKSLGPDYFIDHVHYKETARTLQAAYIAGYLNNYFLTKR